MTNLKQVYWIGGGSGAGKTTVAQRLASARGMAVYSTDAVLAEHARRTSALDAPFLHSFMAMTMDERWVTRSPEAMLDTFPWFRGEGFDLIVDDLTQARSDVGIIVEGFRLLPRLVAPLLSETSRAVWLLPTPEFRRAAFGARATGWDIPNRTSDPERARQNLLDRDRLFTDRLRQETEMLGVPVVNVVVGMSEDELVDAVAKALCL